MTSAEKFIRKIAYTFGDYQLIASTRESGVVVYVIHTNSFKKCVPQLTVYNADKDIEIGTFALTATSDRDVAETLAGLQDAIAARAHFQNIIAIIEGSN